MSQGQQVSPWGGDLYQGALNITADNVASIVRPAVQGVEDYNVSPAGTTLYNTMGGNEVILSGGNVSVVDPNTNPLNPRTAVGVKGSKLYLFTVDGRQSGYSLGMTSIEIAN